MRTPLSTLTRPARRGLAPGAHLIALLIVAAAIVAGITTACSSSSSTSQASGQASGQASSGGQLAFSACMRSHGVSNFPDPTTGSNGQAQVQITPGTSGIDPNSPAYQAAYRACQSLLPAGKTSGGSVSSTVRAEYLRYAGCMRSHGISNYPDPTFNGNSVNLGNLSGIDTNSPQYQSASNACASLNPMNHHRSSQ
jgi:hypothetical protein